MTIAPSWFLPIIVSASQPPIVLFRWQLPGVALCQNGWKYPFGYGQNPIVYGTFFLVAQVVIERSASSFVFQYELVHSLVMWLCDAFMFKPSGNLLGAPVIPDITLDPSFNVISELNRPGFSLVTLFRFTVCLLITR
ncbi:MAG: hypothetical protein OXC07_09470 [Kistimonas sp.]|nr:hypothetical protein [Kistimonas sp.]